MRSFLVLPLLGSLLALFPACSSDPATTGPGGSGGSGGAGGAGGGGGMMAVCTDPAAVPCEDQVIQGMNFQGEAAPGLITEEADGAGFRVHVDATAGGFGVQNPHSYVYGRFTETGLEKVEISDDDSIGSMDWDIAFRRSTIRINSGNSGPSCVAATRMQDGTKYEDVNAAPENLPYRTDEYFSEACEMIPDGSGLPGSPAVAVHFWTYNGCVKMNGNVFVVRLADGRHVKLIVDSYYEPAVQEQCDTTDTIPMMGTGSGNVRFRWAFLP